jgi:hypothetical protein
MVVRSRTKLPYIGYVEMYKINFSMIIVDPMLIETKARARLI